jgi:hypothetical protein
MATSQMTYSNRPKEGQEQRSATVTRKETMMAPNPLSVPLRPEWRHTPVRRLGVRMIPANVSSTDRARIQSRINGDNQNDKQDRQ